MKIKLKFECFLCLYLNKVVRPQGKDGSSDILSGIDFFGTGVTNLGSQSRAVEEEKEGEDDEQGDDEETSVSGKRKLRVEQTTAKKKKKKGRFGETEGKQSSLQLTLEWNC